MRELAHDLRQTARATPLPAPEAAAPMPAMEAVLASLSALTAAGRAVRERPGGQVTMVAIPSLVTAILPAAIEAAMGRYAGLRVATQIISTRQAVDAVARGVADIGLVHDILDDPLVLAENLGQAAMGCAVPSAHRLAGRRRMRVRDLRGLPFASYGVDSPIGERLRAAFEKEGETFAPAFELGASTVICEVALQAGVPAVVEDYIPALGRWPGLRVVPLEAAIPLHLRLITTLQRPVPMATKALGEACRRVVAERFR